MRKRKSIKKSEDESDSSEMADEPEEFQDSGEDWTPAADPQGQQSNRPTSRKRPAKTATSSNNAQKKKRKNSSSDESDEDVAEEEGDDAAEYDEDSEEEKNGSDGNKSDSSQSKDVPKYYHSGNFVLLKSDVKWNGDEVTSKLEELYLWKIDGKALLQKYIPMESNGRTLHKCTCVYSGWNVENRENYYAITEILDKNPKTEAKEPCVALDLADLIKVKDKN